MPGMRREKEDIHPTPTIRITAGTTVGQANQSGGELRREARNRSRRRLIGAKRVAARRMAESERSVE